MNNMANGYYGFTGGGPYGNLTGAYLQPTFQTTALPGVAAVANPPTAYIQPYQTVYAAATPQIQAYDPYASAQTGLTATPYYSAMGAQVLPVQAAAQAFGAAPAYESYYAPLAGTNPAVQQFVYTVPQVANNAALQMAKLQQAYDPTKRYLQATVPTSYYSMNTDSGYSTLTMAPKPLYIATSYANPLPQRQNVTIKTYNVQPVALAPSMLAPVPLAPTIHDNLAAASAVRCPSSAMAVHPSPAASTSCLEVLGSASISSSVNSMYSRSKISTIVGNTCTSRSNSTSSSLTITCTGASSSGPSNTLVTLGRPTERTALSFPGKSSSRSLQLQYCDICKISCAGSQAYREHLDGQKHKRKEVSSKSTPGSTYRTPLHCDVCSVTCTSADMYAAHLRSSRHQKFLKLHAKPTMSSPTMPGSHSNVGTAASDVSKGVVAASKNSTANHNDSTQKSSAAFRLILSNSGRRSHDEKGNRSDTEDSDGTSPDIQPVGVEFVEDIINENGIASSFFCKLCDCKFTDPFAKIMHTKGKRHRFMYKKKVDHGIKTNSKSGESEQRKMASMPTSSSKPHLEDKWKLECDQRRYEEGSFLGAFYIDGAAAAGKAIPPGRRPDSFNDRHVMAKHNSIYPTEKQLVVIQSLVVACEKGLKLVSEHLSERNADGSSTTSIKGVMRVGLVAKGLLLQGDNTVHLVVLCAEKPTRSLLNRVVDALSKHLVSVSSTKYQVDPCVEEAGCIVTREEEPKANCVIMMTSPIIREQLLSLESVVPVTDPPDVLDRQKCLEALALLRHAKWFQARASGFQSCVIVIRVLRDLCQRESSWRPIPEWALELLVEKCISSAGHSLSPGEAFRRVLECISSGILLPGGSGLMDPCEKEATDAAGSMTKQEREDLTASAQDILRQLAFCQIFRVLNMEKLARNTSVKRPHAADLIPSNDEESLKKCKIEEVNK